jgi:hypothetical protein
MFEICSDSSLSASCPTVCPSVYVSALFRLYWFISIKFDAKELRKSAWEIQTLLELGKSIEHFVWRPEEVWLLPATLNQHRSDLLEWNGIWVLGWSRRCKHQADAPLCCSVHTLLIMHINLRGFFLLDSRLNPFLLSTCHACYMPAHTILFDQIITIIACLLQIEIYKAVHIVILFMLLADFCSFEMDMSYARMILTVRCKILHQRTASLSQSQMTSGGRCYART